MAHSTIIRWQFLQTCASSLVMCVVDNLNDHVLEANILRRPDQLPRSFSGSGSLKSPLSTARILTHKLQSSSASSYRPRGRTWGEQRVEYLPIQQARDPVSRRRTSIARARAENSPGSRAHCCPTVPFVLSRQTLRAFPTANTSRSIRIRALLPGLSLLGNQSALL